jgi:secreted protein with Ig-like and vWFA domain
MKPTQDQIEDQLLDSLLHEQNRGDREQAIAEIENALNGQRPEVRIPVRPQWQKRLGIIAASVAIGGFAGVMIHSSKKGDAAPLASLDASMSPEQERRELMAAIRQQEDRVEERRKVLTTLSRTKQIIYHGEGEALARGNDEDIHADAARDVETSEELAALVDSRKKETKSAALERSIDSQDYADAISAFEKDQRRLEGLKRELMTKSVADESLAANEPFLPKEGETLPSAPLPRPRIIPPPAPSSGEMSEIAGLDKVAWHVGGAIPVDDSIEASYSLNRMHDIEGERTQLEKQIESLLKYDSEALMVYASGLDLPDNPVKTVYPQYLELKRQIEGLKASGLGGDHPTVRANERVLKTMKEQLDEDVVNLRTRLQGQLELAKIRVAQNTERYGKLIDPTWQRPTENPLSTFSIDVDTASYSNIRRMIREGRAIPADAVRIEECINAFKYQYEPPTDGKAFAVHTELATCPWNENNLLVKFGIKGREIAKEKRPVSNLVFLIDVSGSMQAANKLPLVKESLKLLLHQLDERDSVSYVVYAGSEGVVLAPTKMTESGRVEALQALEKLESGGSTNGGAGITRAYQLALENFIEGGVNRVILASDGDFNVGVTGNDALVSLVKERAAKNIYLSALAFGTGNLNDSMFEAISNDGNGNYFYIDGIREARKVFLENLTGSLITIAKDVKIQVEFNPGKVGSYRLIGYANRVLKDEDFNNDAVDAGDIGAGHTVTAFYEIVPAGLPQPNGGGVDPLKYQKNTPEAKAPLADPGDEWLTLKLRHKHPEGDISALQETVVAGTATPWQESGSDFQFASAVALFGMKLRGMADVSEIAWEGVRQLARAGLEDDRNEDRAEFVELIGELEKRSR